MTGKILGIPLILIVLVLIIILPLGYGELVIIKKQNEVYKQLVKNEARVLIAMPAIEPTVTIKPEKVKAATKEAETVIPAVSQ